MASDTRPVESHVLYVGESAKVFCADFQDYAPVANGETLSGPSVSITNGASLVTLGSPTVLTADFVDYDRNGETDADKTVPSGKGVKFAVTPGSTRGQCTVTVLVVCSGGATEGKQVNFVVK